ncbi:hypothetical protein CBS101457_002175 [Exobasidium rhododendri]|nr:hypothetical protein CBS101457_002175 [Exobasidium rhododendri]
MLSRSDGLLKVGLLKRLEGCYFGGLDDLRPSVFPLLEDDEEGQKEERLLGLEMLQRGMEAMKAQTLGREGLDVASHSKPSTSYPRPPRVPKGARSRAHECYSETIIDYDERTNRRVAAYEAEEKRWDEGMYLDNYVDEDKEVEHLTHYDLPVLPDSGVRSQDSTESTPILKRSMELLLLELLLAQAYDYRTTQGEATVESAWTTAVLCRSLITSCLPSSESGDTVASILIGSLRRQLSYPLYRSWELSMKVSSDVVSILRQQQQPFSYLTYILKLFTEADDEAMTFYATDVIDPLLENFDHLFRCVDSRALFHCVDMLRVTDVLRDSPTSLDVLADQLEKAVAIVTKSQVGGNWDMEELEAAAREAIQEGEGGYV